MYYLRYGEELNKKVHMKIKTIINFRKNKRKGNEIGTQRCVNANVTARGVTSGCPNGGVVESRQNEAENCFMISNTSGKMRSFKPHG